MTEPIKTGVDVLREMCRIRVKKIMYAGMARDIGTDPESIVAFVEGRRMLSDDLLQKLTRYLLNGSSELDLDSKMLRSTNRAEPTAIGPGPPQCKRRTEPPPRYTPLPAAPGAKPKPRTRPGWLGEWF
jgi:plasmid maintenance system antidote protein VapI